jgi:peptidoglycan/xylan/chitin deacetylase (PgdA/CDA1 family)
MRASALLHVAALGGAVALPAAWPWLAGAVVANHLGLAAAGMWPRSRLLGPNVIALPAAQAGRGEVALSFDDGPDPAVTPAVLDLLEAAGATASFFCIGRAAAANPWLVRDIVARGHRVENHSDTHPNRFAALSPAGLHREVADAQARLADLAGTAPAYFRAPMGLRSPLLQPVLARLGLSLVAWTRRGYDGVDGQPGAVLRRLGAGLAGGDLLLLHDGRCGRAGDGRPLVLAVLPDLLGRLAACGFRGVAISREQGEWSKPDARLASAGAIWPTSKR